MGDAKVTDLEAPSRPLPPSAGIPRAGVLLASGEGARRPTLAAAAAAAVAVKADVVGASGCRALPLALGEAPGDLHKAFAFRGMSMCI